METIKQNTALSRLSTGLQEYALELLPGDCDVIAEMTGYKVQTVRPYTKGEVKVIETGLTILGAMKTLILEREKKVNKALA